MKLIEHLKTLNLGNNGLKKTIWKQSGKNLGLITFGNKRDVVLPIDDLKWNNIKNVSLNHYKNLENVLDPGTFQIWLKNSHLENLKLLNYGLFSPYFYLLNEKYKWLSPSKQDANNRLNLINESHQLRVKGKILYKKKNAGFFLLILGNWYFLPKGESLTFYRPTIWESNYGKAVTKVGYYLEGLQQLLFSNYIKTLGFNVSIKKINKIVYILEKLFAHEISFIFAKGSKSNKRTFKARSRVINSYGYYLFFLKPLIKDLNTLLTLCEKKKIKIENLQKKLENQVEKEEKKELNLLKKYQNELKICIKGLQKSKTKKEINFYKTYCNLLKSLYIGEKKKNKQSFINIQRDKKVSVIVSKKIKTNRNTRKLITVSRRASI